MKDIDITDYKHFKKINIRYDDLDTLGHVNNKAYLSFLEESRIDFHKSVFDWNGRLEFSAVVARIEIDYFKPILYGDYLEIKSKVKKLGNKSFELSSIFIVTEANGSSKIVSKADVVLVNIDSKTGKSTEISKKEKEKLNKYYK